MAFVTVTDERTGKRVKYASEKRIKRMIADMQRKQARLLEGKTLEADKMKQGSLFANGREHGYARF